MSKHAQTDAGASASQSVLAPSQSHLFPSLKHKIGWLGFLALVLPLLAIVSPVNHDETQYIAAAQLVSDGLVPFRDFLYLQTPYQAYLFAPLFGIFEENGFLAARFFTGLLGACILAVVFLTLRAIEVTKDKAAICCMLLWLCHTFVFSVTVVRNDALPTLLMAVAILIAARELSNEPTRENRLFLWLLAGAVLGLAAGTKISFAAPALAFAGFPIWAFVLKKNPIRKAIAQSATIGLGLALALLPLLWFRDIGPLAFDYGNFGYHSEAPLAWYAANGLEDRLTVLAKIRDVLLTLIRGPALFALVIYGWLRLRSFRNGQIQSQFLILIDVLVLAGLTATIAPTPTWRQYAMPLLPPLFVGLGVVWQEAGKGQSRTPFVIECAMLLAALVGVGQPLFQLWKGTIGGDTSPLTISSEGDYLAREAAKAGLNGLSVSLSPEVVLASGLPLDPTFATGPFAYRTASMVAPEDQWAMRITSTSDIAAYLERTRPDTIVTGYENFDHVDTFGLEEPIEAYARSYGYRRIESPFGDAVFWLRTKDTDPQ
ncbi:ArnT family glycosyltransferase [Erythrobacter sp. MTPC3]|uniref:ArnT family glycosyltransferase n=1 Tax=Erythrobacter sp. MTPC3 TaxID=3056564 RepID=UPI0036F3C440